MKREPNLKSNLNNNRLQLAGLITKKYTGTAEEF